MNNTTAKLNITIDLEKLKKFGLTLNEYAVIEYIQALQTDTQNQVFGWCSAKKSEYSQHLNLSEATVYNLLKSLLEKGLIEKCLTPGLVRISKLWFNSTIKSPTLKIRADSQKEIPPITPKEKLRHLVSNDTKQRNADVERILQEFSDLTGYSQPTDPQPRRWAYLFARHKGIENFRPCAKFLLTKKGWQITKLETVYRNYPVYEAEGIRREKPKQSQTGHWGEDGIYYET